MTRPTRAPRLHPQVARHVRIALALGAPALVGACGSTPPPAPTPEIYDSATFQGAPIALERSPLLDRIAELEDRRSDGDGQLLALLAHEAPSVARRAAVALGRLPFPEHGARVTEALCGALDAPATRLEAAFALGLRGDPTAGGVLLAYLNDPDPAMRRAVVEAVSRLPGSALHRGLLVSLRDPDLGVRIEVALGAARWSGDDPLADEVDRALIDVLAPYGVAPGGSDRTALEAELVWRFLFALQRRSAELGRGAFLQFSASDVPLERLFAIKGLGRLASRPDSVAAVRGALEGPRAARDWRVAYEATAALAAFADPVALPTLAAAVEHPSAHVRAGAMSALGALGGTPATRAAVPLARRGLADVSQEVSRAALSALVRLVPEGEALEMIERNLAGGEPLARLAAVEALAALGGRRSVPLLRRLAGDAHPLVSTRAVEALGPHLDPEVRAFLHGVLDAPDNGLRLAAVLALRQDGDPSDVPHLIDAYRSASGDIAAEVAFNVLENLGGFPGSAEAQEFVRRALVDPRPFVRATAGRVLARDFGTRMSVTEVPPRPTPEPVPLPGRDFPAWKRNPLVEVITNRGKMLFELFPAEAPKHVASFLTLAEKGAYDGLTFHRVVPDFVVQGGDYRGDGNGARPAVGTSLRHEFGPRKYVAGSLGMPRNEDPDSGGSQFFVTHRPTPHLDGRYTIFGELRAGRVVLDQLEVGDRILGMRRLRR